MKRKLFASKTKPWAVGLNGSNVGRGESSDGSSQGTAAQQEQGQAAQANTSAAAAAASS